MTYVDGFVIAIPKKNLKNYKKMAELGVKIWKKHGALECFECVGDDLHPKMGGMKVSNFPKITKTKPNETVIFSFIVFKDKNHRKKVNAAVMKDPEMNAAIDFPMPFKMNRMTYGGFKTIVQK